MSEHDDRIYCGLRAEEELKIGDLSTDAKVAAVHYEMALRYSLLCVQPRWTDNVVSIFGEARSAPAEDVPFSNEAVALSSNS